MSQFTWSEADKAKLVACNGPAAMARAFPNKSLANLIRRQAEFKKQGVATKHKPTVATAKEERKANSEYEELKVFGRIVPGLLVEPTVHVVIPDTQAAPGRPTDHLGWIGQYIVDHFAGRPNVKIIHLGDHADMPSLSSYDRGKKAMENRRVMADIEAANNAFEILNAPIKAAKKWHPEKYILHGNHEDRITRAIEDDAQIEGLLSLDLLNYEDLGWTISPFLKPVELDGVYYSHYFSNPMTGRAYGGMVATRLKTLGFSFTMGHQQILDYAIRFVAGKSQHGMVAGACYLSDETYKGYQGNAHWRGIIVCHDVQNGSFDPMFLSLAYLCRRYEGVEIDYFMEKKYRMTYNGGW